MQRWTAVAFALLFALAIGVVVFRARAPVHAPAPAASSAERIAPPPASSPIPDDDLDKVNVPPERGEAATTGFDHFPDGAVVPQLPSTAPASVSFGVILFTYKGAQSAPADAPAREQALQKARELLSKAQQNFDEAVKRGDRGSTADAGRMPRGMLEPYIEYILFSLPKGAVYSEPIDTPRGYWVVKRLD